MRWARRAAERVGRGRLPAAGLAALWAVLTATACASGRSATAVSESFEDGRRGALRSLRRCAVDDWSPPSQIGDVILDADLPCAVREAAIGGLETAVAALNREASCRALFREMGADGPRTLGRSHFFIADARAEDTICDRAVAFTFVGSRWTGLCRRFASLSEIDAAAVILHEALHHAGRSEWPHDPSADRSRDITAEVRRRCGLGTGR